MELLKKIFPFSFVAKDVASLVIICLLHLVVDVVLGFVIGLLAKLPIVGVVMGLVGSLVGLYVLAGLVLALLAYFKVLK
ncbi:MAG: hypothetical protein E7541_07505 [Ruminococcaceae bacterium]|nr:hypothetical protein [Oscillospiraceae bacterium]